MSEKRTLQGVVFSGLGQGGFFTQLDWVKKQCQNKLGFSPFPGTLNLKVDKEYLDIIKELREREGVSIVPPAADFCPAKCIPISIGGIEGAIVIPHAEDFTEDLHPVDVVEIIAPVNIKKALSIDDGAQLSITIE
jgi:CTP-dependent riboflavin kinase